MYNNLLKSEKLEAWLLLLMLALIWGSSYILIKKGLVVFSALQVGTIRIAFAFLFLLPSAVRNLKKVPEGKWKIIIFTGIVGNLIPSILFALAETNLESSLTGILNALSPIFTMLIAVYIFSFRIRLLQIAGIIVGFAGTIGLSFINSSGGIGNMNIYVWLTIIATFCYALSLNFIKAYLGDVSSMVITSLAVFTIGPVSIIYLFSTDFIKIVQNTPGSYEALGYISILGVFGTAIGLILYTRLIHMTTAIFASSVTYLVPIVAIFWGILDGEKIYALHLAGMLFILIGIYLVNKSGSTIKNK
ncbi:MAG TPA: DMT family transporter [Ignavibacteria bacterium]|nr:DMT family transporter [Ignavibacteria bacterium]